MKYHVLLVDDDSEVLKLTDSFLRKKGLDTGLATSVKDALRFFDTETFHCIVLDVMMPEIDGFQAFSLIRERSDAPILFLTGKTEEADRIRGLSLGADDYIIKPCSLEELYLRIMIQIRRQQANRQQSGILEIAPLSINLFTHRAYYNETEEIPLSKREFDLLSLLAEHRGEVMPFERIGTLIDGGYIDADRKNIMVNMSRLRKKLEGYVGLENAIETAWGTGYRFTI